MGKDSERCSPLTQRRMSRRAWLASAGATLAGSVAAAAACDDRWDLRVERVPVRLKGLPRAFDGFTIAQFTDIHRGHRVPQSFVEFAVELTNAAQPDLVVVTGDCITSRLDMMLECAAALARLQAPFGRVSVLGNHEHWTDAEKCQQMLVEIAGSRVLRNESVAIERNGSRITIAGLDDAISGHDDLERTLADVDPDAPVIMLSHKPDVVREASRRGVDLMLAGHTHGGQIVIPAFGAPVTDSDLGPRRASGLHRFGETQIYISAGVGMALLSMRINCPPEVPLITLRAADTT
jgi:predicted MPP superfamily phosphohydrolase